MIPAVPAMRIFLRSLLVTLSAIVLAACGGGGGSDGSEGDAGTGAGNSTVQNIQLTTVDGSTVTGLLGHVPGSQPTRLVVFCHGYGHTVEASWLQYVERTVRPDTAVVTTNYRNNLEFPVLKGAQDTIVATQMALARFPSVQTVYLLGVSMGGAVSGTAITESIGLGPNGESLYDYWVNIEGAMNLFETWAEGTVALPEAAAQIEDDAGGTPLTVPQEYVRRSPVLRTQDMKAGGIRAVAALYAFNDGLVPYNQGREISLALIAAQIPTQFTNVLRDADDQTSGTTLTGAISGFFGAEDPNGTLGLNLTGHASEADANHPLMREGFAQLERMLDGSYDETTPYNETLVDDGGLPIP